MQNQSSENILDEARNYLIREYSPLAILHYGSRQKGTNRPDSDWDLYMVVPTSFDRFEPDESAKLAAEVQNGLRTHLGLSNLKVDTLFAFVDNYLEHFMEEGSHAFDALNGDILYPSQTDSDALVSYLRDHCG